MSALGPILTTKYVRRSPGVGRTPEQRASGASGLDGIRVIRIPDAIAYCCDHVVRFLHGANQGNSLLYHGGYLALDAAQDPSVLTKQRYVLIASDFGLVRRSQARVYMGFSHYFAVRIEDPVSSAAQGVLTGEVNPADYIALFAVHERQAAQSVARAIRDALATTDDEAAAIRDSMIRCGWLANGRSPELTPAGLSLLA